MPGPQQNKEDSFWTLVRNMEEAAQKMDKPTMDQAIADRLNKPLPYEKISDDWPPIPPTPAALRQQPMVIGGPEVHKAVKQLFKVAPELQGRLPLVSQAPTSGVMDEMWRSQIPIQGFANTNLRGAADTKNKQIFVRPDLRGEDLLSTLGHEASHVMGASEIPDARIIGELLKRKYRELFPHEPSQNIESLRDELIRAGLIKP